MSVNAFLQARCSSSRLPGKVLKPLLGEPMLLRQIERIKRSKCIEKLVIVTSTDESDDPIAALCEQHNIACFRGSLNDVLDRFYQAFKQFPCDYIVRLTGDCPLACAQIIDEVINAHITGEFDYSNNCTPATFPDGLDVEILSAPVLEQLWHNAKLPSEREHVTLHINNNKAQFHCHCLEHEQDLSAMRWTVDEQQDFDFVEKIYQQLYPKNTNFSWLDVLSLLQQQPHLSKINSDLVRNAGLSDALEQDKLHDVE